MAPRSLNPSLPWTRGITRKCRNPGGATMSTVYGVYDVSCEMNSQFYQLADAIIV